MVLISDAPSESEDRCHSIPGKIFNFIPDSGARNVSTGSHLWIAAEVSPVPISLYVTMNKFKSGQMGIDQENIVLTQKILGCNA
jgi:hypothetical protein